MTKKEFLHALEEILNIPKDSLCELDELDNFKEWDSIAFLEVTVLISKEFDLDVEPEKIKSIYTVKELLQLCKIP